MVSQENPIKQLNDALGQKLQELKSSEGNVLSLVEVINEILYGTIHEHAPYANAVEIQIDADLSSLYNDMPHNGSRKVWGDYVRAVHNQPDLQGIVSHLFKSHLPFSFVTGTHGSGVRDEVANSRKLMEFQIYDGKLYFKLNITQAGLPTSSHFCYFYPAEVEALRLVHIPDSEFSHAYDFPDSSSEQRVLIPSTSALVHYLHFRGFGKQKISREKIPPQFSFSIKALIDKIRIPEFSNPLLRYNDETRTLSGFAILDEDGELNVYEFDKVMILDYIASGIPHEYEKILFSAYAINLHRRNPHQNIHVYTGNDAIARLHAFQTEQRF